MLFSVLCYFYILIRIGLAVGKYNEGKLKSIGVLVSSMTDSGSLTDDEPLQLLLDLVVINSGGRKSYECR